MDRPMDVEGYSTYHKKALNGRGFLLNVCAPRKDRIIRFTSLMLMELIARMLMWGGRALWASIHDFEGNVVVSPWTARRIWNAAGGKYGRPTNSSPIIVCGPTLNPTFIEEYTSQSFLKAIDFAAYWLDDAWDGPYWVHVIGPNGRIILSNRELHRMYHAEMHASGWTITESIIQTDGSLLGKKLSEMRIV